MYPDNKKIVLMGIGAVIAAAATVAIPLMLLSKQNTLYFLTALLTGIAMAYLGFIFSHAGRKKDIIVEIINIVAYIGLALLSFQIMPYFIVAGYFWHGIWDAIHHRNVRIVQTKVPEWYIYGCMLYDWAVGAFILILLI